jgi:hypothetical protein
MTLVLAAVATLFSSVLRANRGVEEHRGLMMSIQRLDMQFREDVHAAESATAADGKLAIHQPQGEIVTYTAENDAIKRTVEANGQITHRDAFDLLPAATVKFETDPAAGRVVGLLVKYPLDASQPEFSEQRTLRMEATPRSHAPRGNALLRRSASPAPE